MTIRKQWLLALISIAIISVSVNSFVLSSLTDEYFKGYVKENYNKHFEQIVDYITEMLVSNDYSSSQMAIQLETHLVDPITRIKVYDEDNNLIVDVYNTEMMGRGMNGRGMNGMMRRNYDAGLEEVDNAEITDKGDVIGQVNITKYSSAENSIDTWLFQTSLIQNSLYSIGIVLVISIIIGTLISKRMSKDLIQTAEMAQNIDMGNETEALHSKVKEIHVIQQSLESLKTRLKIKQKSRKTLIDEMIHQTRTPLTIMRTHLEAMEDGVIEMSPEEIRVCEAQIENITSIISNMSGMIDAQKYDDTIRTEEFELNLLLKQIISGLRVQFEKKNIELVFTEYSKVILNADKYKLSQAIYNILTNAYKYTMSGGKVQVTCKTEGEAIVITIEDNGPGISKEDQTKIFDAYYRSANSLNSEGEGIGLYVAKENITKLNGTLYVESEINKGSKFVVKL
ncbi:MAG: Sensor histidine kinase [Lachnospiraceae bacterium]|jgi:signal transduction histidine kinase|nr:Sensor histidine kinase [Lachnospiraceae bacterium]